MIRDYFYILQPTGEEDKDDVTYIKLTDAISLVKYLIPRIRMVKNTESNLSSVNMCIDEAKKFLNELQMDLEDDN